MRLSFIFSLCLLFINVGFVAAVDNAKPSVAIVSTPPELRAQGVAETYMVFENFPRNRDFYFESRRPLMKDGDSYQAMERMKLDSEGRIVLKDRIIDYYGFLPLGIAPGEKIDHRFVFDNGTVISEGSSIPRPIQKASKAGTFSLEVELFTVLPITIYILKLDGLKDREPCRLTSISGNEMLDSEFIYRSGNGMQYIPGVQGVEGGSSLLKITRKSGDSVVVRLMWGKNIGEFLMQELTDAQKNVATLSARAE